MSQGRILAIDDEQNIRHLIQNEFTLENFDVTTAKSGEEGLKLLDDSEFDLVLLDIKLPAISGIETLRRLKLKYKDIQVIMITGYGDIKTAIESIKLGARDYITKPFKLDELLLLAKEAIKDARKAKSADRKTSCNITEDGRTFIRCPSSAMQKVYELAARVAPTDNTVLIQGETGVGKDVLAFQIHQQSRRKDGPFMVLDCGLLSQNLAESELYGHRKGAFSGAADSKIGLVEKSHNGSLFLDEIGNIDLELQKKFLRFLETRRYRRVGETIEKQVDTRILLATNMDLQEAMQSGSIRKDMLFRMQVISILVPPLKDRLEDITPLVSHFLKEAAGDKQSKKISPEALEALMQYAWPGNVRELKSVMCKAALMSQTVTIHPDDLPSNVLADRGKPAVPPKSLEEMEKYHIMGVLEATGGNQSQAAKILGINRKTLYKKIHRYKLLV